VGDSDKVDGDAVKTELRNFILLAFFLWEIPASTAGEQSKPPPCRPLQEQRATIWNEEERQYETLILKEKLVRCLDRPQKYSFPGRV